MSTRVNKLDGGARYLIEAEDGRIALTLAEVDELAEAICHRLKIQGPARGGSGLVVRTVAGKELHLAFSEDVPEICGWMRKEFARDFELNSAAAWGVTE